MDNFIIYNTDDGQAKVSLLAKDGTVWCTQAQMAELFGRSVSTISRHIANILKENELNEKSNLHFLQIANSDKPIALYSLDMILAVGFRVRSPRGTQFRRWANSTLKEYLQKGFVLDSERLKNPDGRPDYFDELLAKIRDIRASEKRFYQKLRDLFAEAPRVEKGRKYHLRKFQKILTLFFHVKKPYPYIRMDTAVPMEMAVSRWRVMSHAMRRITTVLYHVPPLFPMNGGFSNGAELQIYHPQASEDEWRGELPADPLLPGSGWEVEAEV